MNVLRNDYINFSQSLYFMISHIEIPAGFREDNPDPFNHGTTTITYGPVNGCSPERINKILKNVYGIKTEKIETVSSGAEIDSNNFRIISDSGELYLFKQHNVSCKNGASLSIEVTEQCREQGLPVAKTILTKNNELFYVEEKKIYCIQPFIVGENYDGSRKEIVKAGKAVSELHYILENIPYRNRIETHRTYKTHDINILSKFAETARNKTKRNATDDCLLSIYDELVDFSEYTRDMNLSSLSRQVIHIDLHPH